jgi:carnitine O-acetyltransferase
VLHVQSFQGYGSAFIKKAGFAPDAFVQMAIQLATYRLFGEQGGTYEATQVRPFLHGRTETTRTVSSASEAFIKKMGLRPKMDEGDPQIRNEKCKLLQEAAITHAKYTGLAVNAQGVDRHFLGLSMLVKDGEKAPTLYSHPLFIRSKRWRVSTSQLTHPRFSLWGYGEVVPDGVGLAYAVLPRSCQFNITALREQEWTDKLAELLEEALLEMRMLVEMDKLPSKL